MILILNNFTYLNSKFVCERSGRNLVGVMMHRSMMNWRWSVMKRSWDTVMRPKTKLRSSYGCADQSNNKDHL